MKANRFAKKEEAQVGIGTMIVFIATILVAAVAAGVLIDTSQKLQDKGTTTGNQAVSDVSSSLQIEAVYGNLDGGSAINTFEVLVSLAAGAEPVDLKDVVVQFSDKTKLVEYYWGQDQSAGLGETDQNIAGNTDGAPGPAEWAANADWLDNTFWIDLVRDTDQSAIDLGADGIWNDHEQEATDADSDEYHGILNEDDLIRISFAQYATDTDLGVGTSTPITITLLSESGYAAEIGFRTPNSFGSDTYMELA